MKLIFCPQCTDVIKLQVKSHRTCACGKSGGMYVNNLDAVISGEAIPIGFHNSSFKQALRARPDDGMGSRFEAFVIPVVCPTIEKIII